MSNFKELYLTQFWSDLDDSFFNLQLITCSWRPICQKRGPVTNTTPKRPRRTTIQTRAIIEAQAEPDRQGHLETVYLSDDSSDEYQNPWNADETGSESEIDVDASDISEGTTSGRRHRSQASHRQEKGQRPMVRISTTCGSQEVPLVRQIPANRGHIIRGRAYSPPTFLSSSMGYWSPLATHSGTTSGVRSSSPVGEPGIPRRGRPTAATH